jgi:hypothetical protein
MRSFYFALTALLTLLAGTRSFAQCGSTDLALHAPLTNSSTDIGGAVASKAVDGDTTVASGWVFFATGTPSIVLDLGSAQQLCSVKIWWATAGLSASAFTIGISNNQAGPFTTVQPVTGNNAAVNTFSITGTARYVRVLMTASNNGVFYSMNEIAVYPLGGCSGTNAVSGHQSSATASGSQAGSLPRNAFDGNPNTVWRSPTNGGSTNNPQTLTVDLGTTQNLCSANVQFGNSTDIAVNYTIDLSTTSGTAGFTSAATVTGNTFDVNVLPLNASGRWVRFSATKSSTTNGYNVQDISLTTPLAILPVNLVNFTATKMNNQQVQLKWTTETETNNKVFLIQRSGDGGTYATIGQVEGAINSSTALDYQWMDESPLKGTNFYRLEQVDLDGRSGFSGIQVVRIGGEASLSVFPNPVKDVLTIVNPKGALIREVAVYNTSGVVLSKLAPMSTGSVQVQAGGWAAGVYLVKVFTDEGSQIIKVMK